jgi:hypothetical protein
LKPAGDFGAPGRSASDGTLLDDHTIAECPLAGALLRDSMNAPRSIERLLRGGSTLYQGCYQANGQDA